MHSTTYAHVLLTTNSNHIHVVPNPTWQHCLHLPVGHRAVPVQKSQKQIEVAIYKLWPIHYMQIFNTARHSCTHTHMHKTTAFFPTATSTSLQPLWRWRLWKVRWPFPNRFATHVAVHAWNRHCLFCNYLFLSTYGFALIFAWWRWLFCDLQHAKHSPNISHTHETIRVMIQSRKQTEPQQLSHARWAQLDSVHCPLFQKHKS